MSTIASPRQSLTLSSRRDSISTDNTTRSASTSRAAPAAIGSVRRNRTALRDYYGLKTANKEHESGASTPVEVEKEHEIDREVFNAAEYVKNLLATEGLEGILRVEAGLVSETSSLDGEKKALIYDNYSKLIAATQTIHKMRMNMDPLGPTTSTLGPAISHIAETATELSALLKQQHGGYPSVDETGSNKNAQQKLVGWVLAAPDRLRSLIASGEKSMASKDWKDVSEVLDRWEGVQGVSEVRRECLAILDGSGKG